MRIVRPTPTREFTDTLTREWPGGPILLASSITGASSTPNISAAVVRPINASLSATSVTPEISRPTITRNLAPNIASQSQTPAISAACIRNLAAAITGASVTSTVNESGPWLIYLSASIVGTSSTPDDVQSDISLRLTASISAASTTQDAAATMVRSIQALVSAQGVTSDIVSHTVRNLSAGIAQGSATNDLAVINQPALGRIIDTRIKQTTPRRRIVSITV